jgi:uncharacterized protein (TIGR00369 family)
MNPLLEELNRKYVDRAPHMHDAGLRITAVDRGRGTMTMPDRPDWLGDPARGRLHPGALTVLADSTCGLAVGTALQQRSPYATLDLRMDYLRPAGPGHDLHCEAHCHRLSRSVAFVRAEVWQARRDEPIAVTQAAFMLSTPAVRRAPNRPTAADAPAAADGGSWQPPEGDGPVLDGPPIPYVAYLGIRLARGGEAPMFRLPFQYTLIGNPRLPALHGGVIAGFAETAATLHVIRTLDGSRVPKGIDFSIDYLRSGRPEDCFAACEVLRLGARVALVQVRCWQARPDQPIAIARGHFLLAAAGATDDSDPAAVAAGA